MVFPFTINDIRFSIRCICNSGAITHIRLKSWREGSSSLRIVGQAGPLKFLPAFSFPDVLTPPSDRRAVPSMTCLYIGREEDSDDSDPHSRPTFSTGTTVTTQGEPSVVSQVHSCIISHVISEHFTHEENETPYCHMVCPESLSLMTWSSNQIPPKP